MCFGDSRLVEGRLHVEMCRHAWQDPLLPQVAMYMRPNHLNGPAPESTGDLQQATEKVRAATVASQKAVSNISAHLLHSYPLLHWSLRLEFRTPFPCIGLFAGPVVLPESLPSCVLSCRAL
jgi:hypothetical protein